MNNIISEPPAMLCRYVRYIDLLKVYEQLEDYNPHSGESQGLSNIPEQFCETLAACFEDSAEMVSTLLAEPWENMKPIEVAAIVGDLIEHFVELLHNDSGQEWPDHEDSVRETVDKLSGLVLTEAYTSACSWELNFLVVYQYDHLCQLWADNNISEAFEVYEIIARTRGQIQHIAALGFQEHRGAAAATKRAQELAKKRHAPTNKLKEELLEEWASTSNEYKSRADFCRIVGRRSGVLERTLSGWIAKHERNNA